MTHTDELIERTIDDVARAMTAAPSPALRARVVARLRPRPSRRAFWLIPATVVFATASVAFLVLIRSRPVTIRPPMVASSAALLNPVIARVPSLDVQRPDAHRPALARIDATAKQRSDADPWRERAVPELPAIADLTIAPIQPTALIIPQLRVMPMGEMAPLAVVAIEGVDRDR